MHHNIKKETILDRYCARFLRRTSTVTVTQTANKDTGSYASFSDQ